MNYFYLNIKEITVRMKLVDLGLKRNLGNMRCLVLAFNQKSFYNPQASYHELTIVSLCHTEYFTQKKKNTLEVLNFKIQFYYL